MGLGRPRARAGYHEATCTSEERRKPATMFDDLEAERRVAQGREGTKGGSITTIRDDKYTSAHMHLKMVYFIFKVGSRNELYRA